MSVLSPNLMIFSDLDGSLLDHDTYSWEPARPWLKRLAQNEIPVIITTSKTVAEVEQLRCALGLSHLPYIAENGALIALPPDWHSHPDYPRKTFDADYPFICAQLNRLREKHAFRFSGFADMDAAEVAALTGLSIQDAKLARLREASEPIQWLGDADSLANFRHILTEVGLSLTQGGRFYHVMGKDVSKGNAVNWIKKQYSGKNDNVPLTIGLGDGPNDISLLCAMDNAVLIKNKGNQLIDLPESYTGKLYRTKFMGPTGWSEGLDYFLVD
ncbi:mannosyl-3-phosphoglycerate phosphatase-related protein [Brenneria goodwinii]|uniref:mannosyl-3-phosphoglycerate phosphatase-related protein n=1 Tax=Brenneria goodwinii TaxID=1109412 RepID=UPI000EF240EC|nr:mannosyl-3-phosphoglycerate phosphatase-related protein [Brenneria goodwinii]MCG8156612.1 mannosyl-3-phosphoglycerate phosphatase-related protein [Brenneria goodwinii]MCG8159680.1 mannosyl-3-phosphoglycerate phosphatase-related protein [Brenneria goodwinii]MCG8165770.1 mannosyl-3-phosphoglycerate phosphatase-related protein [Brenneria goodwinii]MCG8170269.1 mannosyl-3-phosphoglycerate phosphatase-related protein [Brenneria goodwinii]MCG8173539.1 mannosyl-3-phosphoglycerate phosphatase-relat